MIPVDEFMWYGLSPETGPDPTIGDIGASWPCGKNLLQKWLVPFILRVNAGKARQSISPFYS